MNAEKFWRVIGEYNQNTIWIQIILMVFLALGIIYAYVRKEHRSALIALGTANLYIGIVFFLIYGTEPIQTFFAAPLFLSIGLLFWYEAFKRNDNCLDRFTKIQWILFIMVMLYPIVSSLLGNIFPRMTLYIMPCPIASISIVVYSSCRRKNKLLLFLLAVWGLTGVKAFFANALEDTILLICGVYCLYLIVRVLKNSSKRILRVSSLFPATVDVIWEKLRSIDTLRYITAPYAAFIPEETTDMMWREGETAHFQLKLFGFLSFGTHTIRVIEFDKSNYLIYTNEHNKSVPIWNHRIILEKTCDDHTGYTDEVEIYAGWKTDFVYWWSVLFYRHRQRKWVRLLSKREKGSD